MKNLLGTLTTTAPKPVSSMEGVVSLATTHLKAIKYPNRLNDIAVVGTLRGWHRSFLLRPKYGGKFLFLIYPKDHLSYKHMISKTFYLQSFNDAPKVIDITIPPSLRVFSTWEWRVIKIGEAEEAELNFEKEDGLLDSTEGRLSGSSAVRLARSSLQEQSYSTLIYGIHPTIDGMVNFDKEKNRSQKAKMVVWSCHQPYATEDGTAIVKKKSQRILSWYQQVLDSFSPHMVWMLGDSVYSDGTSSLDFVRQVYDKKGWSDSDRLRKDLLSLYRLNYRYHWSFASMQFIMRRFPHLGMWDDHEIRDGYGSEASDFKEENKMIKEIASQASEEYLFQYSPRLRSESNKHLYTDNHQVYENGAVASFIFDGRNSRRYGEDMPIPSEVLLLASGLVSSDIINLYRWHNPGKVISDLQLQDFKRYCQLLKNKPDIKYLLLGNAVPFIYLLDFVETIAAESAIAGTDTGQHIRDDIRDSWHSPANRRELLELLDILRDLHKSRSDITFINISGDIHISNAFTFQPEGFSNPLYQITSSALTNDPPKESGILDLLSVDGPLNFNAKSKDFGTMKRLWSETSQQNFLTVEANSEKILFHLHVYPDKILYALNQDRVLSIYANGDLMELN